MILDKLIKTYCKNKGSYSCYKQIQSLSDIYISGKHTKKYIYIIVLTTAYNQPIRKTDILQKTKSHCF